MLLLTIGGLVLGSGATAAQTAVFPTLKRAQVYQGHAGSIEGLIYTPDGRHVVVIAGTTIYLLDPQTFQVVRSVPFDYTARPSLSWNQNGQLQISDWRDFTVFDLQTGKKVFAREYDADGSSPMSLSPQNLLALASGQDIKLVDRTTGTVTRTITTRGYGVQRLEFSRDGSTLAYSGYDDGVVLVDANTGEPLSQLVSEDEYPESFAFNYANDEIVVDGKNEEYDSVLHFFSATDATLRTTVSLPGSIFTVDNLLYSPNDRWLAGASFDKVFLVNRDLGRLRYMFDGGPFTQLAFNPASTVMGFGDWYGSLRFAATDTGKVIKELAGLPGNSQRCAHFSPDGKRVITCGYDRTARVYDTVTGKTLFVLKGHDLALEGAAFVGTNSTIVTSDDDELRVWSKDGALLRRWVNDKIRPGKVLANPKNTTVAVIARENSKNFLMFLDTQSATAIASARANAEDIREWRFTADGKALVTLHSDGALRVWDAQKAQVLRSTKTSASYFARLAVDPTGRKIAVTSKDGGVDVFEFSTLKKSGFIRQPLASNVFFSADGERLSIFGTSGQASVVTVFRMADGRAQRTYALPENISTLDVEVSPDGKAFLIEGSHPGSTVNATLLSTPDQAAAFR